MDRSLSRPCLFWPEECSDRTRLFFTFRRPIFTSFRPGVWQPEWDEALFIAYTGDPHAQSQNPNATHSVTGTSTAPAPAGPAPPSETPPGAAAAPAPASSFQGFSGFSILFHDRGEFYRHLLDFERLGLGEGELPDWGGKGGGAGPGR